MIEKMIENTITIDAERCTFCGWAEPAEYFRFHTPGVAPVCTSCAEGGLKMDLEGYDEGYGSQGDGNYRSGTPRLIAKKTGETPFAK